MADCITSEYKLKIKIEPMEDLTDIISGRSNIPPDELHIKRDSDIGKIIASFPPEVSFTLTARDMHWPKNDFVVGYIKEPKLVYHTKQDKPLAINPLTLRRAKDRFTNSPSYNFYELRIFSPQLKSYPEQDWGSIKFYTDSPYINYKTTFNDLFSISDDVPSGELHVKSDLPHARILKHAEELGYVSSPYTVRLHSFLSMHYEDAVHYNGPTQQVFGMYFNTNIVYVENQNTPLMARKSQIALDTDLFSEDDRDVIRFVEIDSSIKLEKSLRGINYLV